MFNFINLSDSLNVLRVNRANKEVLFVWDEGATRGQNQTDVHDTQKLLRNLVSQTFMKCDNDKPTC